MGLLASGQVRLRKVDGGATLPRSAESKLSALAA